MSGPPPCPQDFESRAPRQPYLKPHAPTRLSPFSDVIFLMMHYYYHSTLGSQNKDFREDPLRWIVAIDHPLSATSHADQRPSPAPTPACRDNRSSALGAPIP